MWAPPRQSGDPIGATPPFRRAVVLSRDARAGRGWCETPARQSGAIGGDTERLRGRSPDPNQGGARYLLGDAALAAGDAEAAREMWCR